MFCLIASHKSDETLKSVWWLERSFEVYSKPDQPWVTSSIDWEVVMEWT